MKNKPNLVVIADYTHHTTVQLRTLVSQVSKDYAVTILDLEHLKPITTHSIQAVSQYIYDCTALRVSGRFHLLGLYTGGKAAEHFAKTHPNQILSVTSIGHTSKKIRHITIPASFPLVPLFQPALG